MKLEFESPRRVTVLGAGSWGTTAARIIASNVMEKSEFDNEVRMWVFEEQVNGRNLSEIINETHENVKYLPGISLPENVVAVPNVVDAVKGAHVLIFVMPHQFLERTCRDIKEHVSSDVIGISLIKGIDFSEDGAVLVTDIIENALNIDCSVLSGANIASEIAQEKFCESTVGYNVPRNGLIFYHLFNRTYFRVSVVQDVVGPQVYGALKNVIALGAGFSDALGMGNNTKSALLRIGLLEMEKFAKVYFNDRPVHPKTLVDSCGVADLITTCMGGRNRRVAEAFGRENGEIPWENLERKMLNGQKLQGTGTCKEVQRLLVRDHRVEQFPFINLIHRVAFEDAPLDTILALPQRHIDEVIAEMK